MFLVSALTKFDDAIKKLEEILLVVFGISLTLIMMAQVIMRYFLGSPIFWAEEVSVQLLIFMTAFGIAYITKTKQHISIDFIVALVNDKLKIAFTTVINVLFLALMLFVCYYSWDWVFRPDVQLEFSGTTGLPRWYSYLSFPIAFSFLCWHQLLIIINGLLPHSDSDPDSDYDSDKGQP